VAAFIDKFQTACGSIQLARLIIANVTVFLLAWIVILAGNQMGFDGNFTMPWLCVSSSFGISLRHPWTIATYMLTHYDFLHLLFNMLWLYWFGTLLYPRVKGNRLLRLFVGGGLTGAIFYVSVTAFWPESSQDSTYLCGASASVLAIMTSAAVMSPERRINLFLLGAVKLKWIAVCCIALTLLGLGGGNPGAQSAHIGGVLFGGIYPYMPAMRKVWTKKNTSTIRHRQNRNVKRNGAAVASVAAGRLSDSSRLDQLLDKIRLSGYSSLTSGERNELNELSQRIDKNRK